MFHGYSLGGPDLDNTVWFKYSIGFLLTVLVPGWFVVFFGLSWDAATGWAASRCWGCDAWPELSKPGRLVSLRAASLQQGGFLAIVMSYTSQTRPVTYVQK